jgi:hypothetical protein
MEHLLNELQFNTYMLYYGDLLGQEQMAEIIRRQIEIIEHLNQLQQQGVEIEGDDDDDSTITEEEDIINPDEPEWSDTDEEEDEILIG